MRGVLAQQAHIVAIKLDKDGCIAGGGDRVYRVPAPQATIVDVLPAQAMRSTQPS